MASIVAHPITPDPARSRLVDRIVGPDVSETADAEESTRELTVSLEGLLNTKSWSLPGWSDARYVHLSVASGG